MGGWEDLREATAEEADFASRLASGHSKGKFWLSAVSGPYYREYARRPADRLARVRFEPKKKI
jgi:hypothetical protein